MTNVLILHGWEGNPDLYWFPLAKKKFEELGYKVFTPRMPGGYFPEKAEWLKIVQDLRPDENWILIGHSLGGTTILNYLAQASCPIGKAILIATPIEPMSFTPIKNFFEQSFDWEKIKKNCPQFVVLNESDDPVVPLEQGKTLAENLGVDLSQVPGALHFHSIDLDYLAKLLK